MPKIKTETIGFGGVLTKLEYHVDASGNFSCKIPELAAVIVGFEKVKGATLLECQKALRDALEEAEKASTIKRKVILFRFACCVDIWRDGRRVFSVGKSGVRAGPQTETIPFAEGTAIDVWAVVATESEIKLGDRLRYDYAIEKSSIPVGATPSRMNIGNCRGERVESQIEWTKQREEFFTRIILGLEAVAEQLAELAKPEMAKAIADSGRMLLGQ